MKDKDPIGATPLEEEDRAGLLQKHITTREELNTAEFANISKASLKYFAAKRVLAGTLFTVEWLKKLHTEMFGEVWEWAGQFRVRDIVPGVPVHQIGSQIQQFVGDLKSWDEFAHDHLEITVKIHHRLVWIHPFRNGNGRWARMAANIYLGRLGEAMVAWPEDQYVIASSFRKQYIQALQQADRGNFVPLVELHRNYLNK